MTLFTTTKGNDIEDIVFSIADQINHDLDNVRSPELRCDLAKLNEMAGIKAVRCSDYMTSRSYFNVALSLLPPDHWESHYDRSLRLYFLRAKSIYSSGDGTEASADLRRIISCARCLEDKLKSYHQLVVLLFDSEQLRESYITACDVLSQLGEVVPNVMGDKEKKQINNVELCIRSCASEEYFLGMRDMNNEVTNVCTTQPILHHVARSTEKTIKSILEFYNIMASLSFICKPELTPVFVCRMVQLSMEHEGVSKYTILGKRF